MLGKGLASRMTVIFVFFDVVLNMDGWSRAGKYGTAGRYSVRDISMEPRRRQRGEHEHVDAWTSARSSPNLGHDDGAAI